jgi:hypothetical protein
MRKPILYQIRRDVLSEKDLRAMIEGVIQHRENYILYGSPYPPAAIADEIDRREAADSESRAPEHDEYIHELEQTRAQYVALLHVIEEENERIKHEQRTGNSFRNTVI